MKTLHQHTLIYDDQCPMCNIYSKSFIKAGMLDENGREAFTDLSCKNKNLIDFKRSRNEIALINQNTNEVFYGLDSLLLIIGNSFPILEKIARIQPLNWFFKKLYSFVSYNRKQIIPSKKDDLGQACIPDFKLKYRLIYIAFAVMFSAYVFSLFSIKLGLGFTQDFWREFAICLGLIAWQTLFLKTYLKDKIWDYLGNMMTVSLLEALLLIPVLFFDVNSVLTIVYFGIISFMMLLEHLRRCNILKLSLLPTISWMLFRLTVVGILIWINF